ncbi:hypothetical protein CGZ80_00050 [Rhodopirellula sp. MGV]|nr:hypothetical protein CGZ80_00050 [Rhodopirellula sp. MGV]
MIFPQPRFLESKSQVDNRKLGTGDVYRRDRLPPVSELRHLGFRRWIAGTALTTNTTIRFPSEPTGNCHGRRKKQFRQSEKWGMRLASACDPSHR